MPTYSNSSSAEHNKSSFPWTNPLSNDDVSGRTGIHTTETALQLVRSVIVQLFSCPPPPPPPPPCLFCFLFLSSSFLCVFCFFLLIPLPPRHSQVTKQRSSYVTRENSLQQSAGQSAVPNRESQRIFDSPLGSCEKV